jgi:NAD(P)H-hydrate epimerase
MRLLTGDEMRACDREAIDDLGIPAALLMEHAGRAVADSVAALASPGAEIAVVCGSGNNGGDGYVCARWLRERGHDATVYLSAPSAKLSPEAALHQKLYLHLGGRLVMIGDAAELAAALPSLRRAAVLVDALLGTGLATDVRPHQAAVIEALNAAPGVRVAVDIPSGLDADTGHPRGVAVRADHTVTLGFAKVGMAGDPGFLHTGQLTVADIGIPRSLGERATAWLADAAELRALVPALAPTAHKGTRGHVLVVAGSAGKGGAALLASSAALRAGAGLVTLATDPQLAHTLEGQVPEVMVVAAAPQNLAALAAGKRALAVGPGISTDPAYGISLLAALAQLAVPAVLDADCLNHLARATDLASPHPRVLTPHPGEAARLLRVSVAEIQRDRVAAAREIARRAQAVCVLKGARTVSAHPDGRVSLNPTGNPGLGTGGTGDVLTGVIAALLAAGLGPWDAARLGVFAHGRAGDLAAAKVGRVGFLARDVAALLPQAFTSI